MPPINIPVPLLMCKLSVKECFSRTVRGLTAGAAQWTGENAKLFMFAWILKNLWPFSWPGGGGSRAQDTDLPEPDHPIVLIPGICGTQLAVRDKGSAVEDAASRVWVCIAHAVRSGPSDVDNPSTIL